MIDSVLRNVTVKKTFGGKTVPEKPLCEGESMRMIDGCFVAVQERAIPVRLTFPKSFQDAKGIPHDLMLDGTFHVDAPEEAWRTLGGIDVSGRRVEDFLASQLIFVVRDLCKPHETVEAVQGKVTPNMFAEKIRCWLAGTGIGITVTVVKWENAEQKRVAEQDALLERVRYDAEFQKQINDMKHALEIAALDQQKEIEEKKLELDRLRLDRAAINRTYDEYSLIRDGGGSAWTGEAVVPLFGLIKNHAEKTGGLKVEKRNFGTRDIGVRRVSVNTLRIDDSLEFTVRSDRGGHAAILNFGTSGKVWLLTPGFCARDTRVEARTPYKVPGSGLFSPRWEFVEEGPAGREHLVVIVADRPLAAIERAAERSTHESPLVELGTDDMKEIYEDVIRHKLGEWSAGVLSFCVEEAEAEEAER